MGRKTKTALLVVHRPCHSWCLTRIFHLWSLHPLVSTELMPHFYVHEDGRCFPRPWCQYIHICCPLISSSMLHSIHVCGYWLGLRCVWQLRKMRIPVVVVVSVVEDPSFSRSSSSTSTDPRPSTCSKRTKDNWFWFEIENHPPREDPAKINISLRDDITN